MNAGPKPVAGRLATLDAGLGRAAFACCLGLPPALLHARAVADILLSLTGALFLLHSWIGRDGARWQRTFPLAAGLWWAWLVLCSAIGTGGLGLALVAIRLPLLTMATAWALAPPHRLRAVWWMLATCLAWLMLQCWEQHLTGTNLFGQPRYVDGALTGPFAKPRAGPAMILMLFPVLVPATLWLLARPGRWAKAAGIAVPIFCVTTLVLVGQRMPTLLLVLGLVATTVLLPRLRMAVLAAGGCALLLLAAAPVLAPGAYGKLVGETSDQLSHFSQSPYGLIFVRAAVIAENHPVFGLGFDGFRRGCADPANMRGLDRLGVPTAGQNGGLEACNIHPHNYFLEAADNAGLPGLAAFALMACALLMRLGRQTDPLGAGVFVAALVAFWPLATTSAFTSLPNAGWIFLVAGMGLAIQANQPDPAGSG